MKRHTTLFLFAGLLLSRAAYATDGPATKPPKPPRDDSRVYIKLYGYYGLLAPGSFRLTASTSNSGGGTTNKSSFSQSKGLGLGPRVGVGLGYIVSDLINIGVDAEYTLSSSIKAPGSYTSTGTGYSSSGASDQAFTYEFITVTPNIMLKAITKADYYIYSRVGLSLIYPLKFQRSYTSTSTTTQGGKTSLGTSVSLYDYKSNIDLGFQAALGVQFSAGAKVRIFGEIVYNAYTFLPNKSTYTYTNTSTNPASTTSGTYDYTYLTSGDYTQTPGATTFNQQQERIQANSLGLAVGVAYRF